MRPTKGSQHLSSLHPPYLATTLANSGDILFSSTVANHQSNSLFSSSHPPSLLQHQNSSVFSLVDPNIELPTISANEVEQVLSQLQSSSSSHSSAPPPSRKTSGYWFSKDDSFTPPPTKRSFGGCVTPVVTYANHQMQNSQSLQTRSSSLFAALQLPPLGVGPTTTSSSASPPLHAALRRQLLAPSTTFINLANAAKQRQENLTVRLANRAKLTAAARIPVVVNPSTVNSECVRFYSYLPSNIIIISLERLVYPIGSRSHHYWTFPIWQFYICPSGILCLSLNQSSSKHFQNNSVVQTVNMLIRNGLQSFVTSF